MKLATKPAKAPPTIVPINKLLFLLYAIKKPNPPPIIVDVSVPLVLSNKYWSRSAFLMPLAFSKMSFALLTINLP